MSFGLPELVIVLYVIVSWGLTIWAVVDAVRVPSDEDYRAGTKLTWVLVLLFFQCFGAIAYFAIGRPRRV